MMLLGGRVALERLADLEAAELGHHDVQQDQVGLERGHLVERVAAVDGHGDLAVHVGQIRLQQLDVGLVVVGDQDLACWHGIVRRVAVLTVGHASSAIDRSRSAGTGNCRHSSQHLAADPPAAPPRRRATQGLEDPAADRPHLVAAHAARGQRRRADADARGVHRLALVEGNHVLVDRDAAAAEGLLGLARRSGPAG